MTETRTDKTEVNKCEQKLFPVWRWTIKDEQANVTWTHMFMS